jgi:YVTN family beta-propeller protein
MGTRLVPAAFIFFGAVFAQTPDLPTRSVPDPGVVTTRQAITPAGVPTIVQGRVYAVAFGSNPYELLLSTNRAFYRMDWRKNEILQQQEWKGRPGFQSLTFDSQQAQVLTVVANRSENGQPSRLDLFGIRASSPKQLASAFGSYASGAISFAPNARVVAIPLTYDNSLALVNLDHGKLRKVATGIAPFGAAISASGTTAFVTNWGGKIARPGDHTATSGNQNSRSPDDPRHPPDAVVIDERGIASTGTVVRIDVESNKVSSEISVGLHPTAIVWDEPRNRLYVANSNSDSVSEIDTTRNKAIRTINLRPFAQSMNGIAPTSLAISADGTKLFIGCAGINAVAQISTTTGAIEGLIPTAWYPSSLALSPNNKYLAVGTLFGVGAGSQSERGKRSVFAERGSVHVIELPDSAQLANYSTAVSENNHLPLAGFSQPAAQRAAASALPIPVRAGDSSLIEHVVLVVKENRTYDQVLGDLKKGNGDPSLVMFGEDVTPNHHRLADQFVLLDNFYATGEVSADGHQWLTQANETEYTMWPGYEGRSYPFDGTDPIAYARGGFLWDIALAQKKSVRVYGEFTPEMNLPMERRSKFLDRWQQRADFSTEFTHHSPIPPLDQVMAHNFPGYSNAIPDQVRAQIFIKDLQSWEKQGTMPNLTLLQLNCDHTVGTRPGMSTPKAMVADNDLALGRIVEALSRSRFWPKMAIFVVEDDAQAGVDHVDGHRTVALVVSPYSRRGTVDSTFYAHQSILKSIELILGLPTLSLFDMIATDMRNSFQASPDLTAFAAAVPRQSLFDVNPPAAALHGAERKAALASRRMRFDIPDAAPAEKLNELLWHSARGWDVPYPGTRRAVFVPMVMRRDDDDR